MDILDIHEILNENAKLKKMIRFVADYSVKDNMGIGDTFAPGFTTECMKLNKEDRDNLREAFDVL